MAEQKPRGRASRIVLRVLRGLGLAVLHIARVVGTMGGAHNHTADSDRVLYGKSKREDYRP